MLPILAIDGYGQLAFEAHAVKTHKNQGRSLGSSYPLHSRRMPANCTS